MYNDNEFHYGFQFSPIASSDKGVAIVKATPEDVWNAIYEKTLAYDTEVLGKIIITPLEVTYIVYTPKLIRDGNDWRDHLKINTRKVDHKDANILNKALYKINKPIYDLLPS